MEISEKDAKRIFAVDSSLQSAKMRPLSSEELRALVEQVAGGQAAQGIPAEGPGMAPGEPSPAMPTPQPGILGSPAAPQGQIPGMDVGLMPQPPPPETAGGLSKLPSGKGKITADYDEKGRIIKITQVLTPSTGGIQQDGG